MAEIKTSIDYQLDLTVQTVWGDVTSQEILDKLENYYQGRTTRLILWDWTNATLVRMGFDELHQLVIKARKFSRKGGKTAFVFSEDVDFGLGRIIEALAKIENYDYEFCCFRSIVDAEKWLGIPEQSTQVEQEHP